MSDSENDMELSYELQTYSLVRFIHRGRKRSVESIDIVPSKWLDFDKAKGRCITKFTDAPYSNEDLQLIYNLVVNNVDAPKDWPTFSIEQVGRAKTYKEALVKLERLTVTDNVLTLESEDSASEAQAQLTLAVKRQKLQAEASQLLKSLTDDQQDDGQLEKNVSILGKQEDSLPALTSKNYKKCTPNKYKKKSSNVASVESPAESTEEAPGNALEIAAAAGHALDKTAAAAGHASDKAAASGHASQKAAAAAGHASDKAAAPGHASQKAAAASGKAAAASEKAAVAPEKAAVYFDEDVFGEFQPIEPMNSPEFHHLRARSPMSPINILNVPVVHLESVEAGTPFETAVLTRLEHICSVLSNMQLEQRKLAKEIASLKTAQSETTNFLSDKKLMEKTKVDLIRKYEVKIPMKTYEEFQAFEKMLETNSYFNPLTPNRILFFLKL